jgi:hypothetical protein
MGFGNLTLNAFMIPGFNMKNSAGEKNGKA